MKRPQVPSRDQRQGSPGPGPRQARSPLGTGLERQHRTFPSGLSSRERGDGGTLQVHPEEGGAELESPIIFWGQGPPAMETRGISKASMPPCRAYGQDAARLCPQGWLEDVVSEETSQCLHPEVFELCSQKWARPCVENPELSPLPSPAPCTSLQSQENRESPCWAHGTR